MHTAVQPAQTVAHAVQHTASTAGHQIEQSVRHVADAAKSVKKGAEKTGRTVGHAAKQVGHAAADAYQEVKPVVQVAAPIVVGAVVTVYTGGNIYAGAAAASVTSSLMSGERDPRDIAVNVARAEAVAFIGGQVAGQFADVAADGTSVPLTAAQSVEAAAVTSVAADVAVYGETDPAALLEHAAVAGATAYAHTEVTKLDLGKTAETVTTAVVSQAIQSHGHIDPQAVLVTAVGTAVGTEVGEYLKPVVSGTVEPVLVPEVEDSAEQQSPSTRPTPEDVTQPQALAPALDTDTGQTFSSHAEPPNLVVPSESGFSLHAAPDPGTSEAVDAVTTTPAASDAVVPDPVSSEAGLSVPASDPSGWVTPSREDTGLGLLATPDLSAVPVDDVVTVGPTDGNSVALVPAPVEAVESTPASSPRGVAGHAYDLVAGAGGMVGELVTGAYHAGRAAVTSPYSPLSPSFDPELVHQAANAVFHGTYVAAEYAYTDPSAAWDAVQTGAVQAAQKVTAPYIEDWNAGRPFKAIGRGIVEVGPVLVSGVGLVADAFRGVEAVEVLTAGSRVGEAADLGSAARTVGAAEPLSLNGATTQVQTLYRGERASVSPDVVFSRSDGYAIPAKGANADLLRHASATHPDTYYVATSQTPAIAEHFAGQNGWVYVINSDRGIDVNRALGVRSPYPEQFEVAIPEGVFPGEIVDAYPMKKGR